MTPFPPPPQPLPLFVSAFVSAPSRHHFLVALPDSPFLSLPDTPRIHRFVRPSSTPRVPAVRKLNSTGASSGRSMNGPCPLLTDLVLSVVS